MAVHTAKDTATACRRITQWQNRSLLYEKYCSIEPDKSKRVGKQKAAVIETDRSMQWLMEAGEDRLGTELRRQLPRRLIASGRPVKRFRATLKARMMVNMAGTVIENAGLCLDRHFGMPYIPGSALKGIALRGALVNDASPEQIRRVFGEQDRDESANKGLVAFLPAYPVDMAKLEMDVMTGHHGKYYQGDNQYRDAPDTEGPNPVRFPSVAAGTNFEFVVCGRGPADHALVEQAAGWLIGGITELGVGAKTAAGYGWFHYDDEADRRREVQDQQKQRQELEMQRQAEEQARRLAAMTPEEQRKAELLQLDDGTLAGMVKTLDQADENTRQAFLMLMKGEKHDLWLDWKKSKKGKGIERVTALQKIAGQLGEVLP